MWSRREFASESVAPFPASMSASRRNYANIIKSEFALPGPVKPQFPFHAMVILIVQKDCRQKDILSFFGGW